MPLVDDVAALLDGAWTDAEREARSRPPYPRPLGSQALVDRIRAAAAPLFAEHAARVYVPRLLVGPVSVGFTVTERWWDGVTDGDLVCALVAVDGLSDDDVERLIEEGLDPSVVRRQQVARACETGRWDDAERLADTDGFGTHPFVGYRQIAHHRAVLGDAEEFLRLWPRYVAAKERTSMARLKSTLVSGVAEHRGIEAAARLCADKRFGADLLWPAFWTVASTGGLAALDAALASPAAEHLDPLDRLGLLVRTVAADSPYRPEADHPRLADLLDAVEALDPTVSKDVMRQRDGMLLDMWPALGDPATLKRIRAAVRTPNIRRELSRLPRDVG